MKKQNSVIDLVALSLMGIGGLTWLTTGLPQLFGIAGFNVVTSLFSSPLIVNGVMSAFGLSTVYVLIKKIKW